MTPVIPLLRDFELRGLPPPSACGRVPPDALLRCRLGAVLGAAVPLEVREVCESAGDDGTLLLILGPTAVEATLAESENVVLPVDDRPSDPPPKLPK